MKFKVFAALFCIALIAIAIPASAYFIQAENIPNSWDLKTPDTAVTVTASQSAGLLSIVDDLSTPMDPHTPGNDSDLIYSNTSSTAFGGNATAVFKVRTTNYTDWSALAGTGNIQGWERNVVLSFSDGSSWRKCIGFAIRPDAVAITNSTATTLYPANTYYSIDNSTWHTYTVVGSNFGSGGGTFNVYVDGGATAILSGTVNTSTDTAIGYIDGLAIGGAVAGTNRDGTGSWQFDWAAYKAGADATWNPLPEPGSLLALGSGLIGLVGFGIRRRK